MKLLHVRPIALTGWVPVPIARFVFKRFGDSPESFLGCSSVWIRPAQGELIGRGPVMVNASAGTAV